MIDELVGIVFTPNMKSMEKYYRWVCKRYAETFGRLHKNLVDTIFKYNNRERKVYCYGGWNPKMVSRLKRGGR